MKKIVLDLETTNLSPFNAEILELCALFVEDNEVVEEFYEFVKFEEIYDKCDNDTKKTLNFNKIFSQEDLDRHNEKARDKKEVIEEFSRKVSGFGRGMPITGWNNAFYDNIILYRIFEELDYDFREYFDYHSRDTMCRFQPFYEKFFSDKFKLKLENVHKYLIGSINKEGFHRAINDCYATLDMDRWIERYFDSSRRGIRCAGVIFIDDKLVVIEQENKFGRKVYLLPGGGIEHKESPKECVKREVREEIGLEVEVEELLYYNSIYSEWDDSFNMFYKCKVIGGEVKIPQEEKKIKDVKLISSKEELENLRFFPKKIKDKIFDIREETSAKDLGIEKYGAK